MQLLTKIPLKKQPINQIDYDSKLVLIGSCFSENIGNKLTYFKFQSAQNPLGILFHPKAIENLITNTINQKEYTEKDVFFYNERWHCFDAHSSLSSNNKNLLLSNLNNAVKDTHQQLINASHLIITLGTSWVYREFSSDTIVANCHKIPQKKFLKEILPVDEISESLEAIISLVKLTNPKIKFIFTVSPVRHLKDGFVENMQSKAHLVAGINQVIDKRDSFYFPSYEIMMDELRDYRFYTEDMIHPNKTAINYIWNKFSEVWISEKTSKTMQEVATIQKGLTHRPFNENSEQHQQFLEKLNQKIKELKKLHPFIHF